MNRDFDLIKAYMKWESSIASMRYDHVPVEDRIKAFLNSNEYRGVQSTK